MGKTFLRRFDPIDLTITTILVILFIFFIVSSPDVFLSFDIYRSFMTTLPYMGLLALMATFIVTLGEIDLSFPSVMGIGAWAFSASFAAYGSVELAFVTAILVGGLVGLGNGIIITVVGVPPIVATIGTMFFWRGMVNVLAEGRSIPLTEINGTWLHTALVGRLPFGIPMQFIWFAAAAILLIYVYRRHRFGTHVLFIGDNAASAHMMGINVNRVRMTCYVLMGVTSALAGVILVNEVTFFWSTTGEGFLLPALAAVFVGGTSVFGGRGSMYGTLVGIFVIGTLEAGIVAMGIQGFYTQVIYGAMITAAVCTYTLVLQRR